VRGLPPPPPEVVLLRWGFAIDGSYASTSSWILVPGVDTLGVSGLEALAGTFLLAAADLFHAITHAGCDLVTCRLSTYTSDPITVFRSPGPSPGAWTGGQAGQVASGVHLLTSERGKGLQPVMRVPGFPDAFTDDHVRLNQLGFANITDAADTYLNAIDATAAPLGGTCLLGTIHRSAAGAPLGNAIFAPAVGVLASPTVCTVRRRIRSRGQLSPS